MPTSIAPPPSYVASAPAAGRTVAHRPDPRARVVVPAAGSSDALLGHARAVLTQAVATVEVGERFRLAHLAALRVAASVLAERGRPAGARRRLISVWVLIDAVAPEFSDWARYFAAGAPTRAAVEAGARNAVSDREADDQVRAAQDFLHLVERSLGMLAAPLAS